MTATTQRPDDLDMRSMLPPTAALHEMIDDWLAEDIGRLDITTEFLIPADARARFVLNTRDDVVVCGIDVAAEVFHRHVPECSVEILTPDRSFAAEVMGMNLVPYMRAMQHKNVSFTVTYRLLEVRPEGNLLRAVIGSDYRELRQERSFDQIVVNHGTIPLDDLYFELKPLSSNLGAVDHEALISGQPQALNKNPDGSFELYRIGDAVAARNTHAAIYDALRLVKEI